MSSLIIIWGGHNGMGKLLLKPPGGSGRDPSTQSTAPPPLWVGPWVTDFKKRGPGVLNLPSQPQGDTVQVCLSPQASQVLLHNLGHGQRQPMAWFPNKLMNKKTIEGAQKKNRTWCVNNFEHTQETEKRALRGKKKCQPNYNPFLEQAPLL